MVYRKYLYLRDQWSGVWDTWKGSRRPNFILFYFKKRRKKRIFQLIPSACLLLRISCLTYGIPIRRQLWIYLGISVDYIPFLVCGMLNYAYYIVWTGYQPVNFPRMVILLVDLLAWSIMFRIWKSLPMYLPLKTILTLKGSRRGYRFWKFHVSWNLYQNNGEK